MIFFLIKFLDNICSFIENWNMYFVYLGWWDIWCLWDDSLGVVIFWEENEGGFWRVGIFMFKVC